MKLPSVSLTNEEIDKLEKELTHKVYDTALDNSLWPEMIIDIVDHVNRLEAMPKGERDIDSIKNINDHFNRAYQISEKIVELQESNYTKSHILDALSFNVTLINEEGRAFFQQPTQPIRRGVKNQRGPSGHQ